jgi:HSP20 family molecular chaperone IbpA
MNTSQQNVQKADSKDRGLERTRAGRERVPPVDIYENEHELLLVADVPGVSSDRLNLRIEPPELRIEGHTEGEEAVSWVRAFNIDERIASAEVSAELRNGVLTIRLPKAAQSKPRKIEIKAAS